MNSGRIDAGAKLVSDIIYNARHVCNPFDDNPLCLDRLSRVKVIGLGFGTYYAKKACQKMNARAEAEALRAGLSFTDDDKVSLLLGEWAFLSSYYFLK